MSGFSHDPVIDAEMTAIAEGRASAPEPHPFDGRFEPPAEAVAKANPRIPLSEIALASIAISLKRLADASEPETHD